MHSARAALAACGKTVHGIETDVVGGLPLCYGCGRPGSRDGSMKKWRHVGSGPYWADLTQWSMTVGKRWTHRRNLIEAPLSVGECICRRPDCVSGMYDQFKARARKEALGSLDVMGIGQSSPTSGYPSTSSQVQALVANVEMDGDVLDCCGARGDAVSTVLSAHSMCVSTNDFDRRMTADTHMDASTDAFRLAFIEETGRPDWIVTSPPYNNAFCLLKQAWEVARVGVAFKLRITFLEPTESRGQWFREHPPTMVVVLPRATYRGRKCHTVEAWLVWDKRTTKEGPGKPAFSFGPAVV